MGVARRVAFDGTHLGFRRPGLDGVFTGTVTGRVFEGTISGSVCEATRIPAGDFADVEPGCRSRLEWRWGPFRKLARIAKAGSLPACFTALAYPPA